MIENFVTYEGNLVGQLAQWKAASDNARESEMAWLELNSQFHSSAETT